MDILETINSRRSIRKFTGNLIGDEDLKTILKAGFQAPSAHDEEPREFLVIKDKDVIEQIAEFHEYAKMLPDAGCAIVVCGDMGKQSEKGFLIADCSAAMQNILLAAHGLGYGAVWCGLYPKEDLVDNMTGVLNLPKDIIPVGMAVIGEKVKERRVVDRYNEECIHYDKWEGKQE